jgi:hypothetical protein
LGVVDLPDYWLRRPDPGPNETALREFDELLAEATARGVATPIDYRLAEPLWQFLCHAADDGRFVLHGSGDPDIEVFEPRPSNDIDEFGARTAVYASDDGLWPMYFAIVNRPVVRALLNACFRHAPADDLRVSWSEPFYFFSINADAFDTQPFRNGTVYLLPADGFEPQPIQIRDGRRISIGQLANPEPVRPVAKVTVRPEDFPFLGQVRGHRPDLVLERATADPEGFPWLDPTELPTMLAYQPSHSAQ